MRYNKISYSLIQKISEGEKRNCKLQHLIYEKKTTSRNSDVFEFSTFVLFSLLSIFSFAQSDQWVWMKGTNGQGQPGVYGVKGISSPGNYPPNRYEFAQWTDLNGNFWCFGGSNIDPGFTSYYNDLWKYDPATNEWVWMHGDNIAGQAAVTGTQGVSAPGNKPGAKGWAAVTWTDKFGKLWLFGGTSNGTTADATNDLWRYDPATNEWTFMKGSLTVNQLGSYGVKGLTSPTNVPPSRCETSARWVDNNGNLWFYGGCREQLNGGINVKYFGDLWKYDPDPSSPTFNQWTWMGGDNVPNLPGVYGTKGTPAPSNKPGGRATYASWTDLAGNLWLYGGFQYDANNGTNFLNDLWKYDPSIGMWTWMHGLNNVNYYTPAVYGTRCVENTANTPGSQYETRATWTDDCDNLWLFGGNTSNVLWRYNPLTNSWAYISGDAGVAGPTIYGTMGVASPANKPGQRAGAPSWKTKDGLWFFGGMDKNGWHYNDLWKYYPDKITAKFGANKLTGCAPLAITFSDSSTGNCTLVRNYSWNFGDPASGSSNSSVSQNPIHIYSTNGNYTVWLITTGCTGEKDSVSKTINITGNLSSTNSLTNASCGNNDGTATITPSGTGPFTYTWSNGETDSIANGLAPGDYSVTFSDVSGCSSTQSFTITQSGNITSVSSQTNVNCNNGNNATATATPSGGTGTYTYSWNNGQTNQTATGLTQGNYTVTVSDATGCSNDFIYTITEPVAITSSLSQINASCSGGNDGSATVIPSGGTGSFTYTWNDGQTTQTATGLAEGSYTVIYSDASGCADTVTFNITQSGNLTSTNTQTNVLCNGDQNGTVTVNPSGGTNPYTFLWNNGQATQTATGLGQGNYTVTYTDATGCSNTAIYTITEPAALTFSSSQINVNCANENNGTATVNPTGGTGTYSYSWTNGQTTQTATGLAQGNYTVTFTDASGCSKTSAYSITEPSVITIAGTQTNVLCAGDKNGTATISATGGTGDYSYVWSTNPVQTTSAASGLPQGSYTCTITDAAGCTKIVSYTITEPAALSSSSSQTNVSCNGVKDGTASVITSGGTGTHTYSWNTNPVQTTQTATGLGAGNYSVLCTDASGCTTSIAFTLTQGGNLSAATLQTNETCEGDFDGTATVNASGGTGPYTYSWDMSPVQTNATATGLTQGTYSVTYTDAKGCTDITTINILANNNPIANAGSDVSIISGSIAQLNASGGVTYSWSPPTGLNNTTIFNPEASPVSTTTYTVTVTDDNGCTDVDLVTVYVEVPCENIFVPTAFSPNGDGENDVLKIRGNCILSFSLQIFNRWGEIVFETSDISSEWNGTYRGKPLDAAVFVYQITGMDTNSKELNIKGNITLVR